MLAAILFSVVNKGRAENHIQSGLTWKTYIRQMGQDGWEESRYNNLLRDTVVDGSQCLVSLSGKGEPDRSEILLRTDGDKVYASRVDSIDWKLFYDFGVQPGDTIRVYDVSVFELRYPLVITGMVPDKDVAGLERIEFKECYGDGENVAAEGYWIKGLGSAFGPAYNVGYGYLPWLPQMVEASLDGKVVYSNPLGVKEVAGDEPAFTVRVSDGSLIVDGIEYGSAVTVFNTGGTAVHTSRANSSIVTISGLPHGIYIVMVNEKGFKVAM